MATVVQTMTQSIPRHRVTKAGRPRSNGVPSPDRHCPLILIFDGLIKSLM